MLLPLLNPQHGLVRVSAVKTRQRAASKVLCITGVFSWSENSERHILIKARWHIDPQMASGGQSPSKPLWMFSQEISSKTRLSPKTQTHAHTKPHPPGSPNEVYIWTLDRWWPPRRPCVVCSGRPREHRGEVLLKDPKLWPLCLDGWVRTGTLQNTGGKTAGGVMVTGLPGAWCGSPEAPCQFILPAGSVRRSMRSSGLRRERGGHEERPYSTLSLSVMMQLLNSVQFNNTAHSSSFLFVSIFISDVCIQIFAFL